MGEGEKKKNPYAIRAKKLLEEEISNFSQEKTSKTLYEEMPQKSTSPTIKKVMSSDHWITQNQTMGPDNITKPFPL